MENRKVGELNDGNGPFSILIWQTDAGPRHHHRRSCRRVSKFSRNFTTSTQLFESIVGTQSLFASLLFIFNLGAFEHYLPSSYALQLSRTQSPVHQDDIGKLT